MRKNGFEPNQSHFFLLKFSPLIICQKAAAPVGVDVMFEVNPVINQIKEIRERTDQLRGYL